jgi:hypothetical protein
MAPRERVNVTERDQQERDAASAAALEAAAGLSFDQQKEQVRRLNSIMLARIEAKVTGGYFADDDTILGLLSKASTIAKQWAAEERQGGGSDPNDVAALQRAARKAV